MPAKDEHLAKAESNARFLSSIVSQRLAPDWAITVLFYRAMHLMEAWFARRDIHHMGHIQRNQAVFEELREISGAYGKLYDLSRLARYGTDGLVTWADYEDSATAFQQIESHLAD